MCSLGKVPAFFLVAAPRHPQTLGKIERFWGSLWRECVETAVFTDLGDAQWQEHYGRWLVEVFGLKDQDVPDGGCAAGSIAYGFHKAGAHAHGVDLNNHTIALGKLKFPVPLYVCDMVNLHLFGNDSFAFVHTNQCAEHWKKELVPFILKEILRVLKPGGILWTALDTAELFARQDRKGEEEDPTNGCIESLDWWVRTAEQAGFVDVRSEWEPRLNEHLLSFFKRHDWDWFCVQKPGVAPPLRPECCDPARIEGCARNERNEWHSRRQTCSASSATTVRRGLMNTHRSPPAISTPP